MEPKKHRRQNLTCGVRDRRWPPLPFFACSHQRRRWEPPPPRPPTVLVTRASWPAAQKNKKSGRTHLHVRLRLMLIQNTLYCYVATGQNINLKIAPNWKTKLLFFVTTGKQNLGHSIQNLSDTDKTRRAPTCDVTSRVITFRPIWDWGPLIRKTPQ